MSALDAWRRELRGLIPQGFLRRDQGEGLFVSDYPRHGEEESVSKALRERGFLVFIRDSLAYIDAAPEKYQRLLDGVPDADIEPAEETLALYALAQRLIRSKADFSPEGLPVLRLALKHLDGKDWKGLYQALSPLSALAQRQHRPLPAALGKLILLSLREIFRDT